MLGWNAVVALPFRDLEHHRKPERIDHQMELRRRTPRDRPMALAAALPLCTVCVLMSLEPRPLGRETER
jgi:hypothetical protein